MEELATDPEAISRLFGIKYINPQDFMELLVRFFFNFGIALIIVRAIYYPITRRKDYLFTYLMFSVIVFFLCQLLSNVKLGLGFALGLFAIFGIIRYRTDPIPIKEMTYLFLVIGLAAINGLANKKISYAELIFTNVAVVVVTYVLEKLWLVKSESRKTVMLEKIELIKPENHALLLKDLRERTGLNIHRTEIGRINFLRDTARVRVFYYEEDAKYSSLEEESERDTTLD
jgi:hypothetical protein